ncbi:MAG: copper homeostasis protein CutC [Propionibacteriaceae bacterium]|jgi:copper homeostasis protein|nr:copper homeostasis protein CutC [Propionibacteriaceae bacterium]
MTVLEVAVATPQEARRAEEGGADRLLVRQGPDDRSPTPDTVAAIRQAVTLEMRVVLRLRDGYGTDGGEMTRLSGLAWSYLEAGADGMCFGFLTAATALDEDAIAALAGDATWPWTLSRAIDATLDPEDSWSRITALPRCDSVLSAGSARSLDHGLDALLERARRLRGEEGSNGLGSGAVAAHSPSSGPLVIAAGGLRPEHVPWLVRGGIRAFHIGDTDEWAAQPTGEKRLTVERVTSWRRLIDGEVAAAQG